LSTLKYKEILSDTILCSIIIISQTFFCSNVNTERYFKKCFSL